MGFKSDLPVSSLASSIFYGICSLSMAFINKALLSSYHFNYPLFILGCQMAITIIVLKSLRSTGCVIFPDLTVEDAKTFVLPSLFYASHAALALIALEGMNIPMYGALKRCVPLVNIFLAVLILKQSLPSFILLASVLLTTFGCLIAGLNDPTFDGKAYIMGSLSVIMQALYLTLVQQCGEKKLSPSHILYLNSCISVLPFFIISYFTGEIHGVYHYKLLKDPLFQVSLIMTLLMGLVLNFSLFLCTLLNSALTTSIVGVAKSTLQTAVGFFAFGGVTINTLNLTGVILNTAGGTIYSYAKYCQHQKEKSLKTSTEKL